MSRLNSHLHSTGAEFLVLGNLLINGVPSYKAYVNNPSYDIIAMNPDNNLSCRIQVKSRFASDFGGGFLMGKGDFEFLILAALNRGVRYSRRKERGDGVKDPIFYVLPRNALPAFAQESVKWKKLFVKDIPDIGKFENNWRLIKDYLRIA